jgi:hypothetical protein
MESSTLTLLCWLHFRISTLNTLPPFHLYVQAKALHGEQYLEIKAPLPPAATVVTSAQVVDIQDKGKGAVVVSDSGPLIQGHTVCCTDHTAWSGCGW